MTFLTDGCVRLLVGLAGLALTRLLADGRRERERAAMLRLLADLNADATAQLDALQRHLADIDDAG